MGGDDEAQENYATPTYWRSVVANYANVTIVEVGQLNLVDFLQYRRDAFITRMRASEGGREYLEDAWRLEQTKADRAALRDFINKGR